jgi:hypothetical protein
VTIVGPCYRRWWHAARHHLLHLLCLLAALRDRTPKACMVKCKSTAQTMHAG